ncbi:MAG: TatD family hydrolase [Kiritimatiellia bacterium]
MPCLTDAHCHLQDPAFADDLSEVLDRAARFGIRRLVVNGTSPADWLRVAELASAFPDRILPQFGVHPWRVGELPGDWKAQLSALLLRFPRAGIGEIGLDTQCTDAPIQLQLEIFREQWKLAAGLGRPCTVHLIKAWPEWTLVLQSQPPPRFLLHSYSGSAEQVQSWVKAGAYFSFGGAVLRRKDSRKLLQALRAVPAERLLLETDAPFQHPQGKTERQEPAGLAAIAETVAAIREVSLASLLQSSEQAARNLFES